MPNGHRPMTETTAPVSPADALSTALADPAAAWPDVVLREHQVEALDDLARILSHGATRTWVDAPTGSGKTVMFCALAAALGGSSCVLVPRRNLAEQTIAGFARHFPSVTVHTAGRCAGCFTRARLPTAMGSLSSRSMLVMVGLNVGHASTFSVSAHT